LKDSNGFAPLKLNIGSGDRVIMKGYVNVDAHWGDAAYPLEYGDGTVDEVYASHILEHFPHGQVASVLRDWARALKPGGVLKIAVPDFKWIATTYLDIQAGRCAGVGAPPVAAYLMGGQVDEHDFHKAIFDEPTLRHLLAEAGLTNIEPWVSEVNDCASMAVSLNLMGRKAYLCSKCGATDGRTLEGVCYHCHPRREQVCDEWDERVSAFLKHAKGLIRFGANDGAQRETYGGYGIPVIWVEALPDVYQRLSENVAAYPNHRALNYLLTDEDGKEYDFGVATNDGKSSSIFAFADHKKLWPKIDYTHSIKLFSTTFKEMVREERIDLSLYDALIMDIQGAELKALKGMGDLIDGFNWILAEACDFNMYEGCCQLKDLDEYLGSRGFVRVGLFTATGMRGVGQVYDALYGRPGVGGGSGVATEQQAPANGKYFAAGQWREIGQEPGQVALEEVKVAPIGIATSTPRYGSLLAADNMWQAAIALRAQPARSGGAWWEQGLTRQIETLLQEGTEAGPFEFIIAVDFDSYMNPEDGLNLIRLMYENPHLDCIAPTQVRRGMFQEILAQTDGPVTISDPLIPVVHAHFGFTVFRRRVFERMSKPWMLNVPDKEGSWGEGRTDADIYFWHKFCDEGFKAAMSTQVVIGHGDEAVCWPKYENGKWVKVWQSVFEWIQTRKPPAGIMLNGNGAHK